MDQDAFAQFLKRGGRSPSAISRCLKYVGRFEDYLLSQGEGCNLDSAGLEQLEGFVALVEQEPQASAKTHLWAIRYYYESTANDGMRALAAALREQRIKRKPFPLKDFRGVNPDHAAKLADAGIHDVTQMLAAGRTAGDRQQLAASTGIPLEAILELVKLSDLARIPGIKGIRARLYHDAGADTVDKLAAWQPEELRAFLAEWVERTGFDGIAPLPAEVAFSVATAGRLPSIVQYD